MKKIIITLIACAIIISAISGCSKDKEELTAITEEQLTEFQGPVLEFILEDKTFGVNGCYSQYDEDSGENTMYIEAYEELDVDYESYKQKIWDAVGVKFNIVFELIPFPEEPTITGVIRKIEYDNQDTREDYIGTILVVSQTSDFIAADGNPFFDASYITVVKDVDIVNQKGEPIDFSNLEEGMMIDSYYRGMTLTSYPGQQGTEKLVVNENYEMPMTKIGEDETVYTGPYPIAVKGYYYEMNIDEWQSKMVFYMDSGMVYYDLEKGFDEPQLYTGNLNWTFTGQDDTYMTGKIEDVVLMPDEEILVNSIDEEQLQFEVPVEENGKKGISTYKLEKTGIVEKTNRDIVLEVPSVVKEYATEYMQNMIDYYNSIENHTIVEGKISGLTQMNTGTASLTKNIQMWLLEYRLLPENPDKILMAGGMMMEDGWLTEYSSAGQPLLVVEYDYDTSEWRRIGVTNTLGVQEEFMGDYSEAAMAMYERFLAETE